MEPRRAARRTAVVIRASRRSPLRAAPADQLRLLDLQAHDTRLDQLAHRRRTLPEHAEIERLDSELTRLRDLVVAAETERSDIEREQAKADADVQQVRRRADRDRERLDSGSVSSAKDLQSLQHEIESLKRRQGELEDIELAIMERLEEVDTYLTGLRAQQASVTAEREAAAARRDASVREIDDEAALVRMARDTAAGQVDAALVTLYGKVREQQGGTGAAALRQRRCEGCRLELNTTDINRIRAAAEDEVLRCEECRRILVRTPESGL